MEYLNIALTILLSGAFLTFIQFLITRHDKKKGNVSIILDKLNKLERDECRTQMLLLMADYQSNIGELMKVSEHYFKEIGGDWYMTSLFRDYLKQKDINEPYWFVKIKND